LKKYCGRLFLPFLILVVFVFLVQQTAQEARAAESESEIYIPLLSRPTQATSTTSCEVEGTSYRTLSPISEPTSIPAEIHPDINLTVRGYQPTNSAEMEIVAYNGPTDDLAPQLDTLFSPRRLPNFSSGYRVNQWDWDCDCPAGPINDYPVTLLGMATTPGETIHTPVSGYEIAPGLGAMVLLAEENRITLKYTPDDNIVVGYAIHIEDICVEPDLLALYRQMNAEGRDELPVLSGGQAIGRALGSEIKVAIRDTGAFMDPRAQKDWWKAYPVP
jgi:hypothetical protein